MPRLNQARRCKLSFNPNQHIDRDTTEPLRTKSIFYRGKVTYLIFFAEIGEVISYIMCVVQENFKDKYIKIYISYFILTQRSEH